MPTKPPKPDPPPSRPIRVALVGEERITRAGLRMLIDREPGLTVVAECEPLDDAAAVVAVERPDVVLLDFDHVSGDLAPSVIGRLCRKTQVIVLTNASRPDVVSTVFVAGAKGFVRKDETPTVLLKAIQKVTAGEVWLDRATTARLLHELSRGAGQNAAETAKAARITVRERQLIVVVGQGFSNTEIAEQLRISEATVRNHLTSIFRKLELHSRFELVMYALEHGMIKAPLARTRPSAAKARQADRVKSAS